MDKISVVMQSAEMGLLFRPEPLTYEELAGISNEHVPATGEQRWGSRNNAACAAYSICSIFKGVCFKTNHAVVDRLLSLIFRPGADSRVSEREVEIR